MDEKYNTLIYQDSQNIEFIKRSIAVVSQPSSSLQVRLTLDVCVKHTQFSQTVRQPLCSQLYT